MAPLVPYGRVASSACPFTLDSDTLSRRLDRPSSDERGQELAQDPGVIVVLVETCQEEPRGKLATNLLVEGVAPLEGALVSDPLAQSRRLHICKVRVR